MSFGGVTRFAAIVFELNKTIIAVVIGLFLVHFFVATIFVVDGISMEPNLHTNQIVLVSRLAYLAGEPERGDVVVLRFPGDPEKSKYVKRIIGLPGETVNIQNGSVFINGQKLLEVYLPEGTFTEAERFRTIKLGSDDYYVIGDNRAASSDSRIWGQAGREDLIGRTRFILFPPGSFGYLPKIYYK